MAARATTAGWRSLFGVPPFGGNAQGEDLDGGVGRGAVGHAHQRVAGRMVRDLTPAALRYWLDCGRPNRCARRRTNRRKNLRAGLASARGQSCR